MNSIRWVATKKQLMEHTIGIKDEKVFNQTPN